MVQTAALWARSLNQFLFMFLLLGLFFGAAALSLIPLPFLSEVFLIHFYGAVSFATLLYLAPRFWIFLVLPGLWLDFMLQMSLGSHFVLVVMQYGFVFLMRRSLKEYGFFSHWAVFSVSYFLIFGLLSPIDFFQSALTVLIYPLILTWFLKFLSWFKQVNYG